MTIGNNTIINTLANVNHDCIVGDGVHIGPSAVLCGTVTVGGGPVLKMPLVVALVRVSNLQLPIGESVNYGAVEFFLEGQTVNVEQFAVESPSVGLYGFGTATWPDMAQPS